MTKRRYKQGRIIKSITDLSIVIKVCKIFNLPIYLRDRPINPKFFENMTLKTLTKMIESKAIRETIKL